MKMTSLKIVALVSCIIGSCHTKGMNKRPLIIGHRGASGMYPEHTALAYRYNKEHSSFFMTKIDINIVI